MNIIEAIEAEQQRKDIPAFRVGDTVKVWVKVIEGTRETFTVRRVSYGVGVERTFPLHSPKIDRIEITRRGRVRRAKLYYLRDRIGKAAKVKEAIQ